MFTCSCQQIGGNLKINKSENIVLNKLSACVHWKFKATIFHPKKYSRVSSWCNGLSGGMWNRSKRVQTPVALLRSLSDKYLWERYEPPYSPSYGLNSTTAVLL